MLTLLRPRRAQRLLDVGCGTGWFSSRFADVGVRVTGLDPDPAALRFARQRDDRIVYVEGRAEALPFGDGAFDHAAAVTSLCFVDDPVRALRDLWRVSKGSVVLGLLHRHSLLWRAKRGRSGYLGARWDLLGEVRGWARELKPAPGIRAGWAVFLPSGSPVARRIEAILPSGLPLGGFLAVCLRRPEDGRNPEAIRTHMNDVILENVKELRDS
ncbi:MAG: class I SAM-dependent methyltransferase, partial [Pseudomonadota bacterium]|nr:class I SAM-dependent methyltransferase [Pseudomonadota bacterium]